MHTIAAENSIWYTIRTEAVPFLKPLVVHDKAVDKQLLLKFSFGPTLEMGSLL